MRLEQREQKADRHSIVLEVYCNGYVRLVIWQCPGIGAKTQASIVFLVSPLNNVNIPTKILTCKSLAIHFFVVLKTCFTSRATVTRFSNL
jgi:hypothetical protein